MKFSRIALGLGFALASFVGAANAAENLFAVAGNRAQIADPGELLRLVAADPANARIEVVAANAALIAAGTSEIALTLPGGIKVNAIQTQFESMASGNDVWIGQIDLGELKDQFPNALDAGLNHLMAVRSGDTVLANIRIAGQLYRLVPIDGGAHALVEVDQSKFIVDESEKAYAEMVQNSAPLDTSKALGPIAKAISTVRVMVAFGKAATAAVGNEQQAIDLSFSEANQALAATNTDVRFQQAGAIQFYTQTESSTYSTMLSRLTNGADGFYDTIAGQRNTNTADIVAYIAPVSAGLCGQAAGIATSNAQAYFNSGVCWISCD